MKITVFGCGYVGLVTGVCLASLDHDVTCVDVDARRVEMLNRGQVPLAEPGLTDLLRQGLAQGRFRASLDPLEALRASLVSMIAVGTPDQGGHIDLAFVAAVCRTIGEHLKDATEFHTVVVKSTVVPGTTMGLVASGLETSSGRTAGVDFGLAMNPEFLREGSAVEDFMDPDRLVFGHLGARAGAALEALYARFTCPKLHVSPTEAEFAKYASNALLATCISFANEFYTMCEATPDTDGQRVMEILQLDRRLTPVHQGKAIRPGILDYLFGGIGYGGSCLPKDLNAITALARERGLPAKLLDQVVCVNQDRPAAMVRRLAQELDGLSGRMVVVLGLAFKPNTDDWRDSPARPLVEALLLGGANLRAWDPMVDDQAVAAWGGRVALHREPGPALAGAHAAIVATAWPELRAWPWPGLAATMTSPVILDGRNFLRNITWPDSVRYVPVGRGPEASVQAYRDPG